MNRFLALPDSEKSAVFRAVGESIDHNPHFHSSLAASYRWVHLKLMKTPVTFTARVVRDGEWFITFSPEFPEGNGQGLTQDEALESLRESILLLLEDRREDARASLGKGETLIPLALA